MIKDTIVTVLLVVIVALTYGLAQKHTSIYYQGYMQGQHDLYESFAIKNGDVDGTGGYHVR